MQTPFIFCCALPEFFNCSLKFLIISFGKRKHDITYVGSACTTDFSKTSLPPLERNFADQVLIHSFSRSRTKANTCLFEPHIFSGRPKYIPMHPSLWIPRVCFRSPFRSCGTLLPNRIVDLPWFSCWPEAFSYVSMIFISSAHCWTSALQKKYYRPRRGGVIQMGRPSLSLTRRYYLPPLLL